MAYFPQSEEEFRDEYGRGRFSADSQRYRHDEQAERTSAPNDFRDYNHGPGSYDNRWHRGPQPEDGRPDYRRAAQEFGHASRPESDLQAQRRRGAAGYGYGDVAREFGQGRAGYNGDEDRGYDQNGLRGGLGNSGGHDDFADRRFDQDRNPFRGGYGGGDYDHGQRDEPLLGRIGMNSRGPADQRPDEGLFRNQQNQPRDTRRYGRGWNDLDDHNRER
ncbi:hypothetical protein LJ737_13345 [Hymenobacter sp. 15J16-1T3B]|uniref:hypothetical protein n=1 Tax=Hymenobacter sp. 15J16-1T3B TaxID=2886941 RepID=UPI001D12146F|nr:hypothetical protein [Hymenobacter sp. 15J16-1T3B]MCC3158227.1 hypothetical protein [Hymenobacter sp. 15J16-1T3B]